MTASHVGNYGGRDGKRNRTASRRPDSWRATFPPRWSGTGGTFGLADMLARAGVPGFHGFDTRSLVRKLRSRGVMRAGISTEVLDPERLRRRVLDSPDGGSDLALTAGTSTVYRCPAPDGKARFRVSALDYGMKRNIHRLLNAAGCDVTVFPARATRRGDPGGGSARRLLSNGPGDPAALTECVETVRSLVGSRPIFGICLGHQILGRRSGHRPSSSSSATAAATTRSGTSTGNAIADHVAESRLSPSIPRIARGRSRVARESERRDGRGFPDSGRRVLAVQYHPEGAPGPHDARGLFAEFLGMMEAAR